MIRVLGLKLSKLESERKTETPEILNVEHSISDRDELNKIDINPETSSETRDRFFYHFYLFHEVYTRRKAAKGQNQNKDICQGLFTLRRKDSYVEKRRLREILNVVCWREKLYDQEMDYASRIVLIKKKNLRREDPLMYRLQKDYLNKITVKDDFLLPVIKDQIDALIRSHDVR